ncbi:hypothetical protein [Nocardioides sp.]|uniref:hypothetical protein n=1 Tax=Nocardioides sp. TaxID=35761 RepID=UPI0037845050
MAGHARWHSLLREAEELGVDADDAPTLVAGVLADQRRAIRRAEDPDPQVRAALHAAVLGPPPGDGSRRWVPAAVLAVALVVVGLGVALTRSDGGPGGTTDPDAPRAVRLDDDQVPSLFGYDGPDARRLLQSRGLRVSLEPFRSCEVLGRAVGSDPPVGARIRAGDPVTVFTSLPADVACLTDYQDRATTWALLDFATGRGPAPPFADRVLVHPVDGPEVVLSGPAARDRGSWSGTGVLEALRTVSAGVEEVGTGPMSYVVPAIHVSTVHDGAGRRGVPRTPVAGSDDAFAVQVRTPGRAGCPVRLEVYRRDGAIAAVALYPASD